MRFRDVTCVPKSNLSMICTNDVCAFVDSHFPTFFFTFIWWILSEFCRWDLPLYLHYGSSWLALSPPLKEPQMRPSSNQQITHLNLLGQSLRRSLCCQWLSSLRSSQRKYELIIWCWLTASGDSWSNTFFDWKGTQPSPDNPFGNPVFNKSNLLNNEARWPIFLTIVHNASLLETYGLAQAGGVIDSNLTPHGWDFKSEISDEFLATYGNSSSGNWSADSTLFISFFGVNDVNLVLPMEDHDAMLNKIFASYGDSLISVS